MNLTRIDAPSFDLAITLNSGQVFHWEKVEAGFCGTIGERAVYVEQRGELLKIKIEGGALRRHRENTVVRKVSRPTTAATAGSRELTSVSVARVVARRIGWLQRRTSRPARRIWIRGAHYPTGNYGNNSARFPVWG